MYVVLGYTLQNYEIYNVANHVSPAILAEEGTTTKSQISTSLVWDRRDNPFLTRKGERISISSYVAGGPLGGDEQIYGFDIEATKYFRFPGDLILLFDVEAATVDVWNKPELLGALSIAFLVNLLGYPFFVGLLPYAARDVYGTGQAGLGYLAAAFALGAVAGSLIVWSNRLALRAGRIGMVTVHVPDSPDGASFETIRGDLRRFWRRPKALGHYA